MEQESTKLMTPFDCQTIPQWIYLLKLILPYTPAKFQHMLAIFVRFQEMQFTMNHFNGFGTNKTLNTIVNDVKPYMDPDTQEMMEQIESMMEIMNMMEMASDFVPNNFTDLFNMKGNENNE